MSIMIAIAKYIDHKDNALSLQQACIMITPKAKLNLHGQICMGPTPAGGGGGGGGGGLTLVLGTHCKTDSRSCGCRLEKGGLSRTQELSGGGLSEGHFQLGLLLLAWLVQGKHPGLAIISVLATVIRVIVSGQWK